MMAVCSANIGSCGDAETRRFSCYEDSFFSAPLRLCANLIFSRAEAQRRGERERNLVQFHLRVSASLRETIFASGGKAWQS